MIFERNCHASARLRNYFGEVAAEQVKQCRYRNQANAYDGMLLDYHAERRTLIYDNHKFLFALLFVVSGGGVHPTSLVHVDRHWDSKVSETANWRARQGFSDAGDMLKFVDTMLHEGNFLTAACAAGFVRRIDFVVPATIASVERNLNAFRGLAEVGHSSSYELDPSFCATAVLDVDLDYFLDESGQSSGRLFPLEEALCAPWLAVGVALSPTHAGGMDLASDFAQARCLCPK